MIFFLLLLSFHLIPFSGCCVCVCVLYCFYAFIQLQVCIRYVCSRITTPKLFVSAMHPNGPRSATIPIEPKYTDSEKNQMNNNCAKKITNKPPDWEKESRNERQEKEQSTRNGLHVFCSELYFTKLPLNTDQKNKTQSIFCRSVSTKPQFNIQH